MQLVSFFLVAFVKNWLKLGGEFCFGFYGFLFCSVHWNLLLCFFLLVSYCGLGFVFFLLLVSGLDPFLDFFSIIKLCFRLIVI